jgi:hypothetical protein
MPSQFCDPCDDWSKADLRAKPRSEMNLDISKHYRSRSGNKVTIHEIVLKNTAGGEATFPVKCSVRTKKPRARARMQILKLNGRASAFGVEHKDDIVGLWEDEE